MSTQTAGIYRVDLASLESSERRVTPRLVVRGVLIPFVFTRLLLVLSGLFAVYHLAGARAPGWDLPTGIPIIDIFSHFDARWYESIARGGYQFVPGEMCNAPFAPLFPILMRLVAIPLGNSETSLYISGILVSNAALIVSLIYLMALLLVEGHDELTASRAAWYVLIFPTTLFLSAGYPMSLYMALAMAAFYHARKAQWPLVGVLAGLAALSRPDGLLLSGGLAVEYYLQNGLRIRKELFNLIWGPLALAGWIVYQAIKLGHPLAFFSAQSAWNSCPIWTVLASTRAPLQLGPPALFIVLTIFGLTRLRPSYSAFTILMGAVMFTANRYWSITRFILVLFPVYMMLGILARKYRWLHIAYTMSSAPLSAILMMRFALNQWVA
jgi:hypothetical protein